MDTGWLAYLSIMLRNIEQYKSKRPLPNGRKVSRRLYRESKKFIKEFKPLLIDIIPEEYWCHHYFHKFLVYIKIGLAENIEQAIKLSEQEERECMELLRDML